MHIALIMASPCNSTHQLVPRGIRRLREHFDPVPSCRLPHLDRVLNTNMHSLNTSTPKRRQFPNTYVAQTSDFSYVADARCNDLVRLRHQIWHWQSRDVNFDAVADEGFRTEIFEESVHICQLTHLKQLIVCEVVQIFHFRVSCVE